jgi:hypothetical protein
MSRWEGQALVQGAVVRETYSPSGDGLLFRNRLIEGFPEVFEDVQNGTRRGLADVAPGRILDLFQKKLQPRQVGLVAPAETDPVQNRADLLASHAAGKALTAGFELQALGISPGHVHDVGRGVAYKDTIPPHEGLNLPVRGEIHRQILRVIRGRGSSPSAPRGKRHLFHHRPFLSGDPTLAVGDMIR